MILGLALRLWNIGFGLPAINDPDELMFELGALHMLRGHSLNPGWFGHPATTTMYLLALVDVAVYGLGHALGWFASIKDFGAAVFANPGLLILPGRVAMALFGTASIGLTASLARMLMGQRVALLAAAMLAVSPVAVGWSQIIRSDVMATVFLQLALLAMLRFHRHPGLRSRTMAAVWIGVSIATKWPFALGGAAMVAVIVDLMLSGRFTRREGAKHLFGFGLTVLAALFLTSPYLLLAHDVVLRNLAGEAQLHHLGATGGTPPENLLWYVQGPLYRAMGLLGLVFALGGCVLLWQSSEARLIILPVLAAFAIVLISQHLVWERWALPLLPLMAMGAAAFADRVMFHDGVAGWRKFISRPLWATAVAGGLMLPLLTSDLAQTRERDNDTRQRASAWAAQHIPDSSTVMIEHFGFDLYARPWHLIFPLGGAGCVDARALLGGKVDYSFIDKARSGRSNVDYGTMDPTLARSCKADFAILTQYDRYAAERDAFPAEFAAYRNLLEQGRLVATFRPVAGQSGGPLVRVVAFEKNQRN